MQAASYLYSLAWTDHYQMEILQWKEKILKLYVSIW